MTQCYEPLAFKLARAPEQPAKNLIVVFHGHGGDAEKFLPVAANLQKSVPDADVICVEGRIPVALAPDDPHAQGKTEGRTWMTFEGIADVAAMSLNLVFNRVGIIHEINRLIDAQLKARGLADKNLGLFGFSMGGGVALTVGQSRSEKCAGIVSHSGAYLRYPHVKSRPDTLMIVGDADYLYEKTPEAKGVKGVLARLFSYQHDASRARLRNLGMPLTEIVVHGLDHDINAMSEQIAGEFFRKQFSPAATAQAPCLKASPQKYWNKAPE